MLHRYVPGASALILLAGGCTPQNAELTSGSYRAFIQESTSFTIAKDAIDLDADYEQRVNIDCRNLNSTPDSNGDGSNEDEIEAIRLPDRLEICRRNQQPIDHESWIDQGAYYGVGNPLEPWRGEAVITGEQDFQVTFHQRIPGGGDFRFAFVIDPTFQPKLCVQTEDGLDTELVNQDGDWIAGWSEDLTSLAELDELPPGLEVLEGHLDGELWYLNARSYQFNPSNSEEIWSLPWNWEAGHTEAKFVEEFLAGRTTRYGLPSVYVEFEEQDTTDFNPQDMWYCGDDGACNQVCNQAGQTAEQTASDLALLDESGDSEDPQEWYQPMVHCNNWRDPDNSGPLEPGDPDPFSPGLDGWKEMHYSWVVIDPGSDLTVGGNASGAFGIVLDGTDSGTRVYVQGEFDVERIKQARWTTDDVNAIKLEQNDTQLCGE